MQAGDAPKAGPSDEALVERVKDSDGTAFDTLFARYFLRIHRFVTRRLHDPSDAEAAVEDIFMQMLSALDTFRGEAPFAAWLLGLTRRTLAQRRECGPVANLPTAGDTSGGSRDGVVRETGATSLLARARRLLFPS